MTGKEVIENGISKVRKYLSILDNYRDSLPENLHSDITLRGAVERYLYLAVQATIDLSQAIISYKDFRKPSTFSEAFEVLRENNLIDASLEEQMIMMTGFRNRITHDYGDINSIVLHDILVNHLKDIEEFLEETSKII